jgi:hypothetical protein
MNRSNNKKGNGDGSNSMFAAQLLWGLESSKAFSDSYRDIGLSSFDVIIASDIIYAAVVIDPLWETVRQLLSYPLGVFWMAFARRKVPVTIDFVLQKAVEYGFRYKLVSESRSDEEEDHNTDDIKGKKDKDDSNPDIEDAAGADKVYVYVFEWDMDSEKNATASSS